MTIEGSPPTNYFCNHYQGGPDTVCMMFKPGPWEYHCLSKESIYLRCPWIGKPWQGPIAFFLMSYEDMKNIVEQPDFKGFDL